MSRLFRLLKLPYGGSTTAVSLGTGDYAGSMWGDSMFDPSMWGNQMWM